MAVREGLLALLEEGPQQGYQLKRSFEVATGGVWPLNVGQVYTTLARLERDGQVERDSVDAEGHVHYRITDAGRREVQAWWHAEVEREAPPRDELAIKLSLALTVPGVDAVGVLQRQRTATVRMLQEYTRMKHRAAGPSDLSWRLVLESMIFQAEAEVRWLDHCEASLARHAPIPTPEPQSHPVPEREQLA